MTQVEVELIGTKKIEKKTSMSEHKCQMCIWPTIFCSGKFGLSWENNKCTIYRKIMNDFGRIGIHNIDTEETNLRLETFKSQVILK